VVCDCQVDDAVKKKLAATTAGAHVGSLLLTFLLRNFLDNPNSHSLSHISDSKSSKRREFLIFFNAHWLGWLNDNNASIVLLDRLGVLLDLLSSSLVELEFKLLEFASNMSSVTIHNRAISLGYLTRMIKDDDLGLEVFALEWRGVLLVSADKPSSELVHSDVLDVEPDVVSWFGLRKTLMMHLNGLHFSGFQGGGSKNNNIVGLHNTSFNTANGDSSDTSDLVDVLQGHTERLAGGSLWRGDLVKGVQESVSLVPLHIIRGRNHVVTKPATDGDNRDLGWVVPNLLQKTLDFRGDFLEPIFGPVDGFLIHLVYADDHLVDTKGLCKKSVFFCLAVLGDSGFEFTSSGRAYKDSTVSLRGSGNHVLDKVTVARGINDGENEVLGFELPQSDVDGDTTLTFCLQLIKNPGILEGRLSHFSGFLLKFLNLSLFNTTTFVNQVTSGCRFTGINMANNNKVNVWFILSHLNFKTAF
jgi:hypothetical protein